MTSTSPNQLVYNNQTDIHICRNRIEDHEVRIRRLEEMVYKADKPQEPPAAYMHVCCDPSKVIGIATQKAPEGWMYMKAFCDKFNFISITSLRGLMEEHGEFFKDHFVKVGRMVYVDPVIVCELFERGLSMSPQLNRQYRLWKMASGELAILAEKALDKIDMAAF